jgi:hypothetical protein
MGGLCSDRVLPQKIIFDNIIKIWYNNGGTHFPIGRTSKKLSDLPSLGKIAYQDYSVSN